MPSTPHVGDPAPDFALEGTDGTFRLSDHRGQRVVLLFYPGDDTAVCTKQFCSYRDREVAKADGASAPVLGTRRAAFVIDEDGIVRHRVVHTLGLDFQSADDLAEALDSLPSRT